MATSSVRWRALKCVKQVWASTLRCPPQGPASCGGGQCSNCGLLLASSGLGAVLFLSLSVTGQEAPGFCLLVGGGALSLKRSWKSIFMRNFLF